MRNAIFQCGSCGFFKLGEIAVYGERGLRFYDQACSECGSMPVIVAFYSVPVAMRPPTPEQIRFAEAREAKRKADQERKRVEKEERWRQKYIKLGRLPPSPSR